VKSRFERVTRLVRQGNVYKHFVSGIARFYEKFTEEIT